MDGSATGVTLTNPVTSAGLPNTITYDINFTAGSDSVQLKWLALLSTEASQWGGSQLHVRLVEGVNQEQIGNKDVPIQVNKLIPDEPCTIWGYKYDDGTMPLNDWQICIELTTHTGASPSIDCAMTGDDIEGWADGYYDFPVICGEYDIYEIIQPDWEAVSPTTGSYDGELVEQGNSNQFNFVNQLLCGNGVTDPGEQCDDGANGDDTDGCYDDCTFTFCGDDIVQNPNGYGVLEECDDGNNEDGDGCSANCTVELPEPELSVTKTDGKTIVEAGEKYTYSLTVTNDGDPCSMLKNVSAYDIIPDHIKVNESSISHGGYLLGDKIRWDNLGNLNQGAVIILTYDVEVNPDLEAGTYYIDNEFCGVVGIAYPSTAPFVQSAINGLDAIDNLFVKAARVAPQPAVITECANDINEVTVIAEPKLILDKTDSADPVLEGETFRYTLDWELTEGIAEDLTLVDTLPNNLTYVDSDSGTYNETTHTVTWDLGDQTAVVSGSVWIDVQVETGLDDGALLVNDAVISTEYEVPQGEGLKTISASATADEDTTVTALPSLGILKTVGSTVTNPGKTVDYTITVNNSGKGTAHKVTVTDTLPVGLYFYEDGKNTGERIKIFEVGDLKAGEDYTINYTAYVDSSLGTGDYKNTATASCDKHDPVFDDAELTIAIPKVLGEETGAVLVIDKTVDKDFVNPGGVATYTVKVTNEGTGPAENAKLIDVLPDGFTFTESASYTHSWELGDIVPSETIETSYEVKVDISQTPGKYLNLAIASADEVDDVSDKVALEVKAGLVLGAEDTGAGLWDWILAAFALILIAGGISLYSFANKKA